MNCRNCGQPHEFFIDAVRCDVELVGADRARARLGFCSDAGAADLIATAVALIAEARDTQVSSTGYRYRVVELDATSSPTT